MMLSSAYDLNGHRPKLPPSESYLTNGRAIVQKAKQLIHSLGLSGLDHDLGPRALLLLLWPQGLTEGSIHSVSAVQ